MFLSVASILKVEDADYVYKFFQDSYLTIAASTGSMEIYTLVREWIQERQVTSSVENIVDDE